MENVPPRRRISLSNSETEYESLKTNSRRVRLNLTMIGSENTRNKVSKNAFRRRRPILVPYLKTPEYYQLTNVDIETCPRLACATSRTNLLVLGKVRSCVGLT